ncbi:MAG: asparaginase domain-containing protein [Pseudomonadota bacterium]
MTPRLLYAGGTIGAAGTPLSPMPGPDFAARFERDLRPHLPAPVREVTLEWLPRPLDSAAMTPRDWLDLARTMATEGKEPLVLLHGTDTLAWTAAALAMLLQCYDPVGGVTARLPRRIVLTGSQYPAFDRSGLAEDSDGPANILGALADAAEGAGLSVFFAGASYQATRVVKTTCTGLDAFAMPNGPGRITPRPDADAAEIAAHLAAIDPYFGKRPLLAILATPGGAIAGQIEAALTAAVPPAGIHLLGFGTGNLPKEPGLPDLLSTCRDRGIPVVLTSQCLHGRLAPGTYTAGDWLADCGVLSMGDRSPASVQVKLHLTQALSTLNGWDVEIRDAFLLSNIAGEDPAA